LTTKVTTITEGTPIYKNSELAKSVRIAVAEGAQNGTLIGIYAINGADSTYSPVKSSVSITGEARALTSSELEETTADGSKTKGKYFVADAEGKFATPTAATGQYTTTALSADSNTQVTLIVWLEGQDSNCINANAGAIFQISVSFETYTHTGA